ncbi:hypothetical protein HAX54_025144 [Datura stramonium]|uniref:Uncharacterized protein n=1 Tax=Datura stramonium TaxID=4076 RepID=A0ABS8S668_DATST|nr:hypothetical protein [Datura stramonium]
MEVEKGQKESAAAAATPPVTPCGWKRSNDGSFMSNLKEQFHDFVNTPLADHKGIKNHIGSDGRNSIIDVVGLKQMVEKFRKEVHGLKKGGENSSTIQSLPAEDNH